MAGEDKLWADLGGAPLVARSLRMLARVGGVRTVVVVAPAARHAALRALLPPGGTAELVCVEGGARRQDSVAAGIAAAPNAAWYLVHDAARPLASASLARAALDAARDAGAAIPGLPVIDTIKRVDAAGRVTETLDRALLRRVQTPQAFDGDLLRRAHREVRDDVTDDAAMVERLGAPVVVVAGELRNVKVTFLRDLAVVRDLAAAIDAEAGA